MKKEMKLKKAMLGQSSGPMEGEHEMPEESWNTQREARDECEGFCVGRDFRVIFHYTVNKLQASDITWES